MSSKVRVGIIGTVGVPAKYGGFESLIENLLDCNNGEVNYLIICSSHSYEVKKSKYKDADLKYIPLQANGFSSILYDGLSLLYCTSKKLDIILVLGVSGAIFLPLIKLFCQSKIICNIDGMEWKRNKWNRIAKTFLKFSERMAVRFSDILISDNQGITDYIDQSYNKKSFIIAYGSDPLSIGVGSNLLGKYNLIKNKYYFKVCRIEPENNLEIILKAFSNFKIELPLVIVGNWNHSKFSRKLRDEYGKLKNIILIDPIYEKELLNELRGNCKAYIHGHSAGGTNPSLIEAMGMALPIVAFDVNFNRYTLNNLGAYFSNSLELSEILIKQKFITEGEIIYQLFTEKYSKEKIAEQYLFLFQNSKRNLM